MRKLGSTFGNTGKGEKEGGVERPPSGNGEKRSGKFHWVEVE